MSLKLDLERFLGILGKATRAISPYYFLPHVADIPRHELTYRERVYSYELYHQLRSRWPSWSYLLGGEVDKTGHPIIREGILGRAKPDLIVHEPGAMHGNLCVCEIKSAASGKGERLNDLRKLTAFCREAGYFGGILLVFGSKPHASADWLEAWVGTISEADVDLGLVRVALHESAGGSFSLVEP